MAAPQSAIAISTPDDPYGDTLDLNMALATAGEFAAKVAKAARFAGLDDATHAVFAAAAALAERHGRGYGPQDGDVGALTAALGVWLADLRAKARAAA